MSADARYTPYHARWYRRRVSVWWWLKKGSYTVFVLRELTSVAVAFFAVVTLGLVRAVATGPEAYQRFLARLGTPLFLSLNPVAFASVLFPATTWLNLAPQASGVRARGHPGPCPLVAAPDP